MFMKKLSAIVLFAPLALMLLVPQGVYAGKDAKKAKKIVVTNTKDSGCGSLRWAIEEANACDAQSRIVFDIPKCDKGYDCKAKRWVIKTESSIEVSAKDTEIDGFSQKGAKENTKPAGEPSNACVKIVVQSPPVVSGSTAKAFISYITSLIAKDKGLAPAQKSAEATPEVDALIAKLLAGDKKFAQKNAEVSSVTSPLLLPVTGSARVRGILLLGRVN